MRGKTGAAAAAVLMVALGASTLRGTTEARAPAPQVLERPSGWIVRPGTDIRPSPRPGGTIRRTSATTVSYVIMDCFGHYHRYRTRDVWVHGRVIDGTGGWSRTGWLWAGDLTVTGPLELPYC